MAEDPERRLLRLVRQLDAERTARIKAERAERMAKLHVARLRSEVAQLKAEQRSVA